MGYEKCGRTEQYPYDQLFDGEWHVIRMTDEAPLRALRYGAERRGLKLRQHRISLDRYEIMVFQAARVEGRRLSLG